MPHTSAQVTGEKAASPPTAILRGAALPLLRLIVPLEEMKDQLF